ncbi:hypothetical protein [Methanorbis furvi]|uniref:Uncharacterized protein n=1 Tax=Methanorbis furvi TaxID=3028299 RepID=A0AAE4MED2_9EURY|nr:hypothetical protein [Methanocorpusculaceae archaeon Ag1]
MANWFKIGTNAGTMLKGNTKAYDDVLDVFGTEAKYARIEPNLANILEAEAKAAKSSPVVSPVVKVTDNVPVIKTTGGTTVSSGLKSVDDLAAAAAKSNADEAATKIVAQAQKNSSVLGSLGKVAAATGIGVLVGGALASGSSVVLGGGGGDNQSKSGDGTLPPTVTTRTDENGNTYYVYDTGIEGVDEALGWLQQQIDEIIEFLNGLLGGGGSGGSGGGLVVTDGDGSTTEAAGKKMKLIAMVALVIILAAAYFLTRRKNGGTKKGGKK